MTTQVLRPVPTFEQVIRLPPPVVNRPERIPEVSRPDPNTFMNEHFDRLLNLNATMHAHAMHDATTRMASAQYGVPMDTMRGAQAAAASAANSADIQMGGIGAPDVTMGTPGNRGLGAPPGAPSAAASSSGTAPPPPAAPPAQAAASTPFDRPHRPR